MSSVKDYFPGLTLPIGIHVNAFGGMVKHPKLNYRSDDPATVQRQMAEIKAWGFDEIKFDWYGFQTQYMIPNRAAALWLEACEQNGMKFVLSVDSGALKQSADPNVDLISMLNFADTFYLRSSAYKRFSAIGSKSDGKALVFEFGMETLTKPIDWNGVQAAFPQIGFIHRNVSGFATPGAGAYAWIDAGESYLDDFYKRALTPSKTSLCFGSVFVKYDDRAVDPSGNVIVPNVNVWGKVDASKKPVFTVIPADNGQTLLDTVAKAQSFLQAGGHLDGIYLNTYADWPEGSAIEGGVSLPIPNTCPGLTFAPKPLFNLAAA